MRQAHVQSMLWHGVDWGRPEVVETARANLPQMCARGRARDSFGRFLKVGHVPVLKSGVTRAGVMASNCSWR